MTPSIDILIPTLWRHERLPGLVGNIHDTTTHPHRVIFVVESHDADSRWVIEHLDDPDVKLVVNDRSPNCCGAFNAGFAAVEAPYWFAGGDDLIFHPQWDEPAMSTMRQEPPEDDEDWIAPKIVGTNDFYNINVLEGRSATHFLVDTEYARTYGLTFDEQPGIIACEQFGHDYFDTEACEVAKTRGVFRPCLASHVEHRHWCFAKADVDRTYQRNQDLCKGDPEIFAARLHAWELKAAAA